MTPKILLVDDEANILQAYTRILRRRFTFETALGGGDALQILQDLGPFAVVVSDMRMPGMDGIELLSTIKERYPDTVRIMLTGNADQGTAVEAVNRGSIYRFLTKPCDPELLAATLEGALAQYALATAERELLEQTLKGSVEMMGELLSLLDPASFGRARSMSALAEEVALRLGMSNAWSLTVASVLSQIGVLTVPASVVAKLRSGAFLNSAEREIAQSVPEIGSSLIRHIPRLGDAADAIQYMNKNFNGTGFPRDERRGGEIPLGARILRVVNDYLSLQGTEDDPQGTLSDMKFRTTWYDMGVLKALQEVLEEHRAEEPPADPVELPLERLQQAQTLAEDVVTAEGILVLPKGARLGKSHLEKLRNFHRIGEIGDNVSVYET
jgi:response regulator RpfG family c-di-GMP phosphodiesterase